MTSATLTRDQAQLATRALMPKLQALQDLLATQLQLLPPGCTDWMQTEDEVRKVRGTLQALNAIGRAA